MAKSVVRKAGSREYAEMMAESQRRLGNRAPSADKEWAGIAKAIRDDHEKKVKKLNADWAESFRTRKPIAYHERLDILNRENYAALTDAKQKLFEKYKLGDVPVSDYEYSLWAKQHDPRTPEIDRLSIRQSHLGDRFRKSLDADIESAKSRGEKLRYEKAGELNKFSTKTRRLYRERETVVRHLSTLKEDWPATPDSIKGKQNPKKSTGIGSSLQSIESSRSDRSRSSDERQEHSLVLEPDDPRVKRWKKDPGTADVRGVDTPKKRQKVKSPRKPKPRRKNPEMRGMRG